MIQGDTHTVKYYQMAMRVTLNYVYHASNLYYCVLSLARRYLYV